MPKNNDLSVSERFLSFVQAWLRYDKEESHTLFGEGYLSECSTYSL